MRDYFKDHITSTLPDILDPLTFAYCPNKSTDDTLAITLHTALSHLDKRNTYLRMLFIDYSSAFNTIAPSKLIIKLEALGLNPVQLGSGLYDGPPSGGEGRKQHLHLADHQHWGPTRVHSEPSPVLPVHPQENNLNQRQQNKGDDRGLQETAEGAPPYPQRRDSSGEGRKLSSLAYTSRTN